MDKVEAFEAMMRDVVTQAESEKKMMDELRAQGWEKSATYKQYMGNRLKYQQILALYRRYERM